MTPPRKLLARAAMLSVALAFAATISAQHVTSPMTGTTQGRAPVVSGVFISNQTRPGQPPRVGDVLLANYSYSDPDTDPGTGALQWFRAGVVIAGAVNPTYVTLGVDAGRSLSVQVTPSSDPASTDPAIGLPVAAAVTVQANPLANVLRVSPLRRQNMHLGYCSTFGGRVATVAELQAIFVNATSATVANGSQSNSEMCTVHGWPLNNECGGPPDQAYQYYWASDTNAVVSMRSGRASTISPTSERYAVCVR